MYWKAQEDVVLENHVEIHGERNWKVVAELLGRSENSCFQRWFNHLKPGIEHNDFTSEEEITIIRLHKKYGNQWSKIVKKLSATRSDNLKRTPNKVKNFWYGPITKKASELNLEVDTEDFLITMTQILRDQENPQTTSWTTIATSSPVGGYGGATTSDFGDNYYSNYDARWDYVGNGAAFTIDDVPSFNWED